MFKKVTLVLIIAVLIIGLFNTVMVPSEIVAHDGTHSYSPDCYDLINFYSGWPRDSRGNIHINYTYDQNGEYYYGYRILKGGDEWSSHFSFFNFNEVSSDTERNTAIFSSNYGDTGWVGVAYYRNDPKEILLNEWYHKNYSNYDFVAYERVAIHEYGHLHGLDHTDCTTEIMSNNPDRDIKQVDLGDGDVSGINDKY